MESVSVPESSNVSERIVEAIAHEERVSPIDMSPIYEAIDPDALERLITSMSRSKGQSGEVSFRYHGYDVVVTGDKRVSVSNRADG